VSDEEAYEEAREQARWEAREQARHDAARDDYEAEIAEAERNRIIELVEANYANREQVKNDPMLFTTWNQAIDTVLAAIKEGESNAD